MLVMEVTHFYLKNVLRWGPVYLGFKLYSALRNFETSMRFNSLIFQHFL